MAEFIEKLPNVFEYEDYRLYLRDYYQAKKKLDSKFSFRVFANEGGFKSSATLKRVFDGERNLSLNGIEQFIKALHLGEGESHFFKNLVLFNQENNPDKKDEIAKEILKSKTHQERKPLAKHQYEFWAGWYNSVIREMIALEAFKEDPEWIASQVIPKISPERAKRALEQLEKLEMVKRNQDGKLEQAESNIRSGDMVLKTSIRKYHRKMVQRAKESIDRFSREERFLSSVTLGLNQEKLEKIKVLYNKFKKELIAIANEETPSNQIFQANFQLFPLSQPLKTDKKN